MPIEFPVAKSHLWLNRGDGRFEDASASAGIDISNGKGTSLVAADVDGSGKLDLLIGNYDNPNFFFKNGAKRGERPRFFDQALVSGLALGADGVPRRLGAGGGRFQRRWLARLPRHKFDRRAEYAVSPTLGRPVCRLGPFRRPLRTTFLKPSFGTQIIDGDLDGNIDLFIANSNVDDILSDYLPYKLPPSYMKNDGSAHFTPVPEETLGPYFKDKYLGRAVARLDWNRDGREDVAISNLRAPGGTLDEHDAARRPPFDDPACQHRFGPRLDRVDRRSHYRR